MHHAVDSMRKMLAETDVLYQTLIAAKLQAESYVTTSTLTAEELNAARARHDTHVP